MKQLFSHYFPTPKYLNMNSCALDISDESIKYGQLLSTASGFKFTKFGKEKIPEGIIASGKIEDEKKLVDILKKLRDKNNLNYVRVSLPEEQVYIFTLSLPQMQGQDLREVILLQIEEYIPLKAANIVFDYDTIQENEKSTIVGVTAIPVDIIESYLSVFNKAGLIPLSFESEAQAITRAVFPYEEKDSVMVVDFGHTRTGVSISYNGNVLFTTTLDIGGSNLTQMIAKNFSISFEEAEEMKASYSHSSALKMQDIFPVILNGVSVLHDELNKQYIYWKTHNEKSGFAHEKINRIILCGGNSNLSGLPKYLEATMKIKVERANTWVNIFNMETSVPGVSFKDSLGYATVLGLGLSGFFNKSQSIVNVLPLKEKKVLRQKYWARLITMFLSLSIMIEVLLIILLAPSYLFSLSKQRLAESRIESFNIINPEIEIITIDSVIKDINTKLSILSRKNLNQQIGQGVFGWLLENRPKGVSYSQMLYNKRTDGSLVVDIHGTAEDRFILGSLKSILDNNPDYTEVNLPISNFLEKTNLNFTISIILK